MPGGARGAHKQDAAREGRLGRRGGPRSEGQEAAGQGACADGVPGVLLQAEAGLGACPVPPAGGPYSAHSSQRGQAGRALCLMATKLHSKLEYRPPQTAKLPPSTGADRLMACTPVARQQGPSTQQQQSVKRSVQAARPPRAHLHASPQPRAGGGVPAALDHVPQAPADGAHAKGTAYVVQYPVWAGLPAGEDTLPEHRAAPQAGAPSSAHGPVWRSPTAAQALLHGVRDGYLGCQACRQVCHRQACQVAACSVAQIFSGTHLPWSTAA